MPSNRSSRQAQLRSSSRRRTITVVAAGVVVVVVLAVVAFAAGGSGKRSVRDNADPAAFDLPGLQRTQRISLAAYRGTPVVVNMFASWCVNCRQELPAFARAASELRGRVQFVGINSQETGDGVGMAKEFDLASKGFALARDIGPTPSASLHDAYGARGMPVTVFYDRDGKLLRTFRAQVPEETLRATLKELYNI
ncbi:MAG: hypothetical protein NVS3B21_35140 [Acidimicrobiales bacterium]